MNMHNHFSDANNFSQKIKTVEVADGLRVKKRYFTPGWAVTTIPIRNLLIGVLVLITLALALVTNAYFVPALVQESYQLFAWVVVNTGFLGLLWFASAFGYRCYNAGFIFHLGNRGLTIDLTPGEVRIKKLFGWYKIERREPIRFVAINFDTGRRNPVDREKVYFHSKEVWIEHGEIRVRLADMCNAEEARELVQRLQLANDLVLNDNVITVH